MKRLQLICLPLFLLWLFSGESLAQEPSEISSLLSSASNIAGSVTSDQPNRLSSALEVGIVLTIVTLLPSIFMTMTSFMRILIVLSFVKRAMGTQELPPNPVIVGIAFFLTVYVMYPTANGIYEKSISPYLKNEMSISAAASNASGEISKFLLQHTRESDLALFLELADLEQPETPDDLSLRIIIPSFILSELKTSFQMGFIIFLPFLVIDLVISSILLSMGMFMLPPVMISTPFKILLFVLVDGWNLVISSLVTSFA